MQKNLLVLFLLLIIVAIVFFWIQCWFPMALTLLMAIATITPALRLALTKAWQTIPKALVPIVYWTFIVAAALAVVLFAKTYMVDMLRLPSSSMEPNFKVGQIIVVNKLHIGPRLNPDNIDGYERATGFGQMQRNDIVVFNVPFQTIDSNANLSLYKKTLLSLNKRFVLSKPRYIKRLIALPGDTLEISNGKTMVNGKKWDTSINCIKKYKLKMNRKDTIPAALKNRIRTSFVYSKDTVLEMEHQLADSLGKRLLEPFYIKKNLPDPNIFPYMFLWNSDNMGPLIVPRKGTSIVLTTKNLPLYKKIITQYEGNTLSINKKAIIINGEATKKYTFKMNYYWVMGDNIPHSFDSRYWGFLPENHIIGISKTHFNLGF
jgi:signal peptidase I